MNLKLLDYKKYNLSETDSKLEFKNDYSKDIGILIIFIILFFPLLLLSIYLILMVYPPNGLVEMSYFVFVIFTIIFFSMFLFDFLYLYFHNKNRVDIFIFDKKRNLFIFKRELDECKEILKIPLIELKKINYYHREGRFGNLYYLRLILKNTKKLKLISGTNSKEHVKIVGDHLSNFLKIPLVNEEPKIRRELIIYILLSIIFFGSLIYFGIFLSFYSGKIWLGTIMVYLVIFVAVVMIGGLLLFIIKKSFNKKKSFESIYKS